MCILQLWLCIVYHSVTLCLGASGASNGKYTATSGHAAQCSPFRGPSVVLVPELTDFCRDLVFSHCECWKLLIKKSPKKDCKKSCLCYKRSSIWLTFPTLKIILLFLIRTLANWELCYHLPLQKGIKDSTENKLNVIKKSLLSISGKIGLSQIFHLKSVSRRPEASMGDRIRRYFEVMLFISICKSK